MVPSTNILACLLILCSSLLALSYETTFAFDRPVHSIVCVFLFAGSVLLAATRFFPAAFKDPTESHHYDAIPLADLREVLIQQQPLAKGSGISKFRLPRTLPRTWIISIVAGCILCLRIELFRQIIGSVECSKPGVSLSIPVLVSIYDFLRNKRWKPLDGDASSGDSVFDSVYFRLTRHRLRYVLPAVLLMYGGVVAASWGENWGSTYICPTVSGLTSWIRAMQVICVVLDFLLIVIAAELSQRENRTYDGKERPLSALLGFIFLGVASFWIVVGFMVFIIHDDQRGWMLSLEPAWKRSVLVQALLFTQLSISVTKMVSHVGVLSLTFLVAFIFVYVQMMSTLWVTRTPFPPLSLFKAILAVGAALTGAALYLMARTASEAESKMNPRSWAWLRRALFICLAAVGTLLFLQHSEAHYHPIDVLIFDGKDKHQQWVAQATGSPNLEHAVIEYQRRYNRQPPPGFDKWYEFAAARSNLIIDDFDQIYEDLLPFQAMTPEHLRELTNQMVVNPSNNIAAVTIRDGTANIQEDILPTHRWMADGVAKMIAPFAEHLPDMDIALNLNDECMVAVPWEALDYLKSVGDTASTFDRDKPVSNAWSSDRASTWPSLNMTDEPETEYFVDYPFKRTFNRYAAQTCPPDSKARQAHFWDRHSLCVSCAHPHTLGQFVSDWSLAGDICHQPDLEHLHGFFLSPAAFSVSQLPMPVFSQSKVQGFNDILYPSAWNYIDKVKYDPSENQPDMAYPEKESTLVWRGATSEGVSLGGTWKGMTRQRLLHLVNNNTLSGVSVLLYSGDPKTYEYYKLDGTMPHTLLNLQTDAQIADKITRCVGGDCDPQAEELGIGDRIDFQDHWKYRFLFDMDGAGFSGRFLPFLQSHSVPFRTGLFRQWFDSRLTPWRHFVPIDVRLHDLWSTLAYFAGAEVTKEGEEKSQTFMKAHDLEGTLIAEEGRTWAEKVLRKEDMEIYFFRLLLEWGRLTDDRRDDLGFTTG